MQWIALNRFFSLGNRFGLENPHRSRVLGERSGRVKPTAFEYAAQILAMFGPDRSQLFFVRTVLNGRRELHLCSLGIVFVLANIGPVDGVFMNGFCITKDTNKYSLCQFALALILMIQMKTTITPRRKPLQKRSTQMLEDIVQGAIRVLKRQGGRRFTTIRVAEEAGISVGSLYQYFPNKESILFRVQQEEWAQTSGLLLSRLKDQRYSPHDRLRRTVRALFRSEAQEASLRKALGETGINLEHTREFLELRTRVFSEMSDFISEVVPALDSRRRKFTGEFVLTTMSSLAEQVTSRTHSRSEVERWASNCAEMLLLFLNGMNSLTGALRADLKADSPMLSIRNA